MAALVGVVISGPAFGASLHDIFSGIGDSFSEIWHADVFPDIVGSEDQQPTQSAEDQQPTQSAEDQQPTQSSSRVELGSILIICGSFALFVVGCFFRREWSQFVTVKNDVKAGRVDRVFNFVLGGCAFLVIGSAFITGGVMIFLGFAALLGYL